VASMNAAFARILLRYASMALVMWGLLGPSDAKIVTADPDLAMIIEMGVGLAVMAGTELWYWAAKRFGGST
jgi:hypothetical protein